MTNPMIEAFARRRVLIGYWLYFKLDSFVHPEPIDYIKAIAQLDVMNEQDIIKFFEIEFEDINFKEEIKREILLIQPQPDHEAISDMQHGAKETVDEAADFPYGKNHDGSHLDD